MITLRGEEKRKENKRKETNQKEREERNAVAFEYVYSLEEGYSTFFPVLD